MGIEYKNMNTETARGKQKQKMKRKKRNNPAVFWQKTALQNSKGVAADTK